VPYNPFEDLHDFTDLKTLVAHILTATRVKAVKVPMPGDFDHKLIHDPDAILPVGELLVGDATFSYIRYRAKYIITKVKECISKINDDKLLSYADKFQLFNGIKRDMLVDFRHFDTRNPIRYMSEYEWMIVVHKEVEGKYTQEEHSYPSTKLDLNAEHWNILENTFAIRRHLLYEIICLLNEELEKLSQELSETKYEWIGSDLEIHELIQAINASKKIQIIRGDEKSFVHELLALLGKSDSRYSYFKGKILDRDVRSQFLPILTKGLEDYGKSSKELASK